MTLLAVPYSTTWDRLQETFERVAVTRTEPVILSSLPYTPKGDHRHTRFPLVLGPPGRLVAMAIGLRAALADTPLILVGAADSVTLGTNHLIHAARRNIGMTLLVLRSDLLSDRDSSLDRTGWTAAGIQETMEQTGTPLEWATALQASLVGRGSIRDPEGLASLVCEAVDGRGFSVIGVTGDPTLPLGVMSRLDHPEFFDSYRQWAAPLQGRPSAAPPTQWISMREDAPPRVEVRIAGLGGQGVKLSGTILSEAAGLGEGLWATHYGEYGSATRGGPSKVDVVMGSRPISYAGADHPDILVLLSQSAADANLASADSRSRVVIDESADDRPEGALIVPITRFAREHTGKPIAAGVTALGCVAALSGVVTPDSLRRAVGNRVPGRSVETNIAALDAAYEFTRDLIGG